MTTRAHLLAVFVALSVIACAGRDPDGDGVVPLSPDDATPVLAPHDDELVVPGELPPPCPTAAISSLEPSVELFDFVRFDGNASTPSPGTSIVSYAWTLAARPAGSTAVLSSEADSITELPVDVVGAYTVELRVTDSSGVMSCNTASTTFTAVASDGLAVMLTWDHPTADLDLHTLHPGGAPFAHDDDVYFGNRAPPDTCVDACATWSADPSENPRLAHDDDDGYGPELTTIESPAACATWSFAVHYWNSHLSENVPDAEATATLRVFIDGALASTSTHTFDEDQEMWSALDVAWPCTDDDGVTFTGYTATEPFPRPF